jgi:3-deoxy-manno-octulosonate cytidylyltransferase (CMP-KDO synthetase)
MDSFSTGSQSHMNILGVIPARYASTRFPGKPLVVIDGKSMIQRVYEQAVKCTSLAKVVVATDNEAISNHVAQFGGNVIMTGEHHRSGTERCHEVVTKLNQQGETYDYVINIQGDEPFIEPQQISQVAGCFSDPAIRLATLIRKITSKDDLVNPNVVKVVVTSHGSALLFSRSAIPFTRGSNPEEWLSATDYYKHIGIYGYKSSVLGEIVALPPSKLEIAESLEQLRWLENGYRIQTQVTEYESIAIDTPADLLKITNRNGTFLQ